MSKVLTAECKLEMTKRIFDQNDTPTEATKAMKSARRWVSHTKVKRRRGFH